MITPSRNRGVGLARARCLDVGHDIVGNLTIMHRFMALIHVDRRVAVPEFLPAHSDVSPSPAQML